MLANRVREYTATIGSGAITLAGALPAHIAFKDAFTVGDSVTYVIEDGENYEIGTGTLLTINTLARTTVSETLVGDVYTKVDASAIDLSGNARVFCAATADFLLDPTVSADVIKEYTDGAGIIMADPVTFINDVNVGGSLRVDQDSALLASFSRNAGAGWIELFEGSERKTYFGFESAGGNGIASGAEGDATVLRAMTGPLHLIGTGGSATSGLTLSSGTATFGGNVQLKKFVVGNLGMVGLADDGAPVYAGGTGNGTFGANIQMYAENHPAAANDMNLRAGSTSWLYWDNSIGRASLAGDMNVVGDINIDNAGIVTGNVFKFRYLNRPTNTGDLSISAGDEYNKGANILMYGGAHATNANDTIFRSNGGSWLRYNSSTDVADFQNTNITTSGIVGVGGYTDQQFEVHGTGSRRFAVRDDGVISWNTQQAGGFLSWDTNKAVIGANNFADLLVLRGGSATENLILDANGNAEFAGDVNVHGHLILDDATLTGVEYILRGSSDGAMVLGAGSVTSQGSNITIFGGANATNANDIRLRADTSEILYWDNSAANWSFKGHNVVGIANLRLEAAGGTNGLNFQAVGAGFQGIRMQPEGATSNAAFFRTQLNGTNTDIILRTGGVDGFVLSGVDQSLSLTGKLIGYGGAKINVHNQMDSGADHGIYLWDTNNTAYVYYMASAGGTRSSAGVSACVSLDNRHGSHIRSRVFSSPTQGFLWENNNEIALMSLTADTGHLSVKGDINAGSQLYINSPNSAYAGASQSEAGTAFTIKALDTNSVGDGDAFSAITWAAPTAGSTKVAAIAPAQQTADNNTVGLNFYVHPSNISSDALALSCTLHHNKDAEFFGKISSASDVAVGGKVNLGSPTELTIASGAVTVVKAFHILDTEGDAASDDLSEIMGGNDGDTLILRTVTGARKVSLKDDGGGGTIGNLLLAGDCTLSSSHDTIQLIYDDGFWRELSRSHNA